MYSQLKLNIDRNNKKMKNFDPETTKIVQKCPKVLEFTWHIIQFWIWELRVRKLTGSSPPNCVLGTQFGGSGPMSFRNRSSQIHSSRLYRMKSGVLAPNLSSMTPIPHEWPICRWGGVFMDGKAIYWLPHRTFIVIYSLSPNPAFLSYGCGHIYNILNRSTQKSVAPALSPASCFFSISSWTAPSSDE